MPLQGKERACILVSLTSCQDTATVTDPDPPPPAKYQCARARFNSSLCLRSLWFSTPDNELLRRGQRTPWRYRRPGPSLLPSTVRRTPWRPNSTLSWGSRDLPRGTSGMFVTDRVEAWNSGHRHRGTCRQHRQCGIWHLSPVLDCLSLFRYGIFFSHSSTGLNSGILAFWYSNINILLPSSPTKLRLKNNK